MKNLLIIQGLAIIVIFIGIFGAIACSPGTTTIINNTTVATTSSTPILITTQPSNNLQEANSEVAAVMTANQGYFAEHGTFAANSTQLISYLNQAPDAVYAFNESTGAITNVINGTGITKGLQWDSAAQQWK